MFEVMKDRRPDYTLYANIDMIKLSKGFEDIIIPVDWNDDNKNIGKSKEILKRTKETLNEGKCLLVFPSSRLSKRKGFKLFERPWLNTIVKLSKKYNAPIIPFHMDGHNSLFYYFLDIFNAFSNTMLLRSLSSFIFVTLLTSQLLMFVLKTDFP